MLRAWEFFLFPPEKHTGKRYNPFQILQNSTAGRDWRKPQPQPNSTGSISQLPHAGLTLLSYPIQRIILKEPMPIFPGQSWCYLGPTMNANITTFSRMRLMPIFSTASTGEAQESPPASSGRSVKPFSQQASGRKRLNQPAHLRFAPPGSQKHREETPLVTKCGKCKNFLKKGCSLMFDLHLFQAWSTRKEVLSMKQGSQQALSDVTN